MPSTPEDSLPSTTAASERVAAYLRDAILTGQIGPGERIRQEDIATRLGASRLPVREALHMLETEGLTQLEVNKGARVPALDISEVNVIYQMRERLEPLALMESIPNLTDENLGRIVELRDAIERSVEVADFLDLDRTFHLLTYAGCQSDELLSTVTRMWNSTQHYRRAFMKVSGDERRWIVHAEHRLLVDAIFRRDSTDAERFLAGHIRRTRISLIDHPEVFSPHN